MKSGGAPRGPRRDFPDRGQLGQARLLHRAVQPAGIERRRHPAGAGAGRARSRFGLRARVVADRQQPARSRDDARRRAYLEAARSIGSDFELRRVLSSIVKAGPMTPAIAASVLDTSGVDRVGLRAGLAARRVRRPSAARRTRRARPSSRRSPASPARSSTAGCSRRCCSAPTSPSRRGRQPSSRGAAIESDFEAANVPAAVREDQRRRRGGARAVLPRGGVDRLGVRARPRAAGALAAVGRRPTRPCSRSCVRRRPMDSSFERAQVLLAVAGTHPLTREARDAYIDASDKLGDFEQGRVLVGAGEERAPTIDRGPRVRESRRGARNAESNSRGDTR